MNIIILRDHNNEETSKFALRAACELGYPYFLTLKNEECLVRDLMNSEVRMRFGECGSGNENGEKAVVNYLGNRSGKCVLHGGTKNWIGNESLEVQKEREREHVSFISCQLSTMPQSNLESSPVMLLILLI